MKVVTAAASALLVAAVYVFRLDRAAGLVVDDAYYILLGQSLAQGGPFALVSSAAAPILPSVPPMFPALLALVFRIAPSFPDNVVLLKAVSIAAMLGAGACTFFYVRDWRNLPPVIAWCAAMAVALTPAFVFLATSTVMSECVFALAQLATVMVVERAAERSQDRRTLRAAALGGALTAATWLVRSAGIALVGAALLRLVHERRWPAAAAFAGTLMVCAGPWLLYSARHQPSAADRDRYGGSIVVAYGDAVRLRVAGTLSSGRGDWAELPLRAARNVVNIFGRDTGGLVAPALYRSAGESGEEVFSLGALGFLAGSMGNSPATIVLSLILSVVAGLGYVVSVRERTTVAELLVPLTLAMLLLYPYWTYRFVLPLVPFLHVYLLCGCRAIAARMGGSDAWRPGRILALTIVTLHIVDHTQYIRLVRNPMSAASIDWLADARGFDDAMAWMQANVKDAANVASTNPALVYLRTGHRGVTFDGSTVKLGEWKTLGIRYVASFRAMDVPAELAAGRFVYRDPQRRWWIIAI